MKMETQEVKVREKNEQGQVVSKTVGTANYAEYDSTAEAVSNLGEEKVLELINAQVRTNEMNRVRALARGGPSIKALKEKALALITGEEWAQIAGNPALIAQTIERKVAELKAQQPPEAEEAADE